MRLVRVMSLGALAVAVCVLAEPLLSVPALAQDAVQVDRRDGIEQIIVTARRREEDLQSVPLAVTAVSAEALTEFGVATLEEITALAPNIKINAGRGSNSTINAYIRGVGQNDPLWGFEPGVGVYIDDVYMARPQGALLDVYDVERIEVLRGPQGTLYGKNTLAGAIKYVTRDIVADPFWTVTAQVGRYDQLELKASGSTPVTENIHVGAAIARLTRDGYGQVVQSDDPQVFNRVGEDVSDKDLLAARAKVVFSWGDDSRIELLGDMINDDSNARGSQRLNDSFGPRLPSRYDVRSDMPVGDEKVRVRGASASFTTGLTDAWTMKAIAAYREGETRTFIDFDTLNVNAFNVPAEVDDDQRSLELQFNYDEGGQLRGVAGLYYFDGTACGSFNAVLGQLVLAPGLPQGLTNLTQGCVDTESYSVFADATFSVTSRLNVSAGLRWNRDEKDARVFVAQYIGGLAGNQSVFDPDDVPPGLILISIDSDYEESRTFKSVSPRLSLDYEIGPDMMAYVSYAQGFKSGGFDMRGNELAFPATRDGYDSETVDNYEVGLKSTWLDRRLLLNLTAFFADYQDVQIGTQRIVEVGGAPRNVTAVLNAGEQENKGIELEMLWNPTDRLSLMANLGWLDAKITEFLVSDPADPTSTLDVSNLHKPINAPKFTAYVSGAYRWPLAFGELLARVGYQYRDDTKVANTIPSIADQKSYDLVDATIALTTADGRWRFALDGRNLTDEKYLTSGYDFGPVGTGPLGGLSQIGFYGAPRTWTFSATYTLE
jgi:iron complex outermembrane recepter protein